MENNKKCVYNYCDYHEKIINNKNKKSYSTKTKCTAKTKKLLNLNDMKDIKYLEEITEKEFKQDNIIYNVFTSLREKINAPARKRTK